MLLIFYDLKRFVEMNDFLIFRRALALYKSISFRSWDLGFIKDVVNTSEINGLESYIPTTVSEDRIIPNNDGYIFRRVSINDSDSAIAEAAIENQELLKELKEKLTFLVNMWKKFGGLEYIEIKSKKDTYKNIIFSYQCIIIDTYKKIINGQIVIEENDSVYGKKHILSTYNRLRSKGVSHSTVPRVTKEEKFIVSKMEYEKKINERKFRIRRVKLKAEENDQKNERKVYSIMNKPFNDS